MKAAVPNAALAIDDPRHRKKHAGQQHGLIKPGATINAAKIERRSTAAGHQDDTSKQSDGAEEQCAQIPKCDAPWPEPRSGVAAPNELRRAA